MITKYRNTDDTTKRIVKMAFIRGDDDDPDISYLGEFTDTPGPTSIRRDEAEPREFKYFTPAMTGDETGNPDSPHQDWQRAEAFAAGEWHMVYCYAAATVSVGGVMQTIHSGGIGGVESDSDTSHFTELRDEQLDELADILTELGFTPGDVAAAVARAKTG